MNILFITHYECCPQLGGTERATDTVARGLAGRYGHSCYSIYRVEHAPGVPRTPFVATARIPLLGVDEIAAFIRDNAIDAIVNQGMTDKTADIRRAVEASGRSCRLIYFHHYAPMAFERKFMNFSHQVSEWLRHPLDLREMVKTAVFPLWRARYAARTRRAYAGTTAAADYVTMLSPAFFRLWRDAAGDGGTLRAIPNPLSFDTFIDDAGIDAKQKKVLVVGRMEEYQKRISLVLKIWERLENRPGLADWQLEIIGDGESLADYRRMAARLSRVTFRGNTDPRQAYRESALFMLTSRHEGWGLTLTEASQMGCVPLAFRSFESLPDIITDGVNGYTVPDGDIDTYADRMASLMLDPERRVAMARAAVGLSRRFSLPEVMDRWQKLLTE